MVNREYYLVSFRLTPDEYQELCTLAAKEFKEWEKLTRTPAGRSAGFDINKFAKYLIRRYLKNNRMD